MGCIASSLLRGTLFVFSLSIGMSARPARADIFFFRPSDHGRAPVPMQMNDIAMAREVVELTEDGRGRFSTVATFWMRSYAGRRIRGKMGFPLLDARDIHYHPFHVWTQRRGHRLAKKIARRFSPLRKRPTLDGWKLPKNGLDYPAYATWETDFGPHETKKIVLRHGAAAPLWRQAGFGYGRELLYVVRTGAIWRGSIGRADICFNFREDPRTPDYVKKLFPREKTAPAVHLVMSYPKHARWVSSRRLCWTFKDWLPHEDIYLRWLAFTSLSHRETQPVVMTATSYRGARDLYTPRWLAARAEAELAPWKAIAPKKVAAVDRDALMRFLASWYYREIFARHGDPLAIVAAPPGKRILLVPENTKTIVKGYAFGVWRLRFERFRDPRYGAWYQPKHPRHVGVTLSSLTPRERANALFLDRYLRERGLSIEP